MSEEKEIKAFISSWFGGMNSSLHPVLLPKGQYALGENVVNRGGIIQTRPGLRYCGEPAGTDGTLPQGIIIFTPKNSRPTMLVAVSGFIYQAKFPFRDFTVIENLKFSSTAPVIVMEECLKITKQTASGTIEIVDPIRLVIIQDGTTKPGYYDGVTAKHLEPNAPQPQTPVGLWMEWTSYRLWLSSGTRVYASDIGDPTSFVENTYLAERSAFELGAECTGLIETTDKSGLLAFTPNTTTAFQSSINPRSSWQLTPNFQREFLKQTGCVSGLSPCNQYGLLYWYSKRGLVNLDSAMQSEVSSEITTTDAQMTRQKSRMSPIRSGIATCAFENFLLCSVPVGSKRNAQTWILDQSPTMEGGDGENTRSWAGYWTGVQPVQWAIADIAGTPRCFFLSYDHRAHAGTRIHVWEGFRPDRLDKGGRIAAQFETHFHVADGGRRKIKWIEFDLCEIFGNVNVTAYVGGIRGPWIKILETELQAEIGSIGSANQPMIDKGEFIHSYKPQTRIVRSKEFSTEMLPKDDAGCPPELGGDTVGRDKGFSVLVQWVGQMGIQAITIVTDDSTESKSGTCPTSEAGSHNAVTERGETIAMPA